MLGESLVPKPARHFFNVVSTNCVINMTGKGGGGHSGAEANLGHFH